MEAGMWWLLTVLKLQASVVPAIALTGVGAAVLARGLERHDRLEKWVGISILLGSLAAGRPLL